MRIVELAKEYKKSPKDFIKMLNKRGIHVKKSATFLADNVVEKVLDMFPLDRNMEDAQSKDQEPKLIPWKAGTVITLSEFAKRLEAPLSDVMMAVLSKGLLLNLNSEIDTDTAEEIAKELNILLDIEEDDSSQSNKIKDDLDKIEEGEIENSADDLEERPPVITIMGHVDHGKTLLLDAIRKTNVVDKEAGGITQHIGAYQVKVNGKPITFLDTPGHEAFTALRARGAQVTDIAIIVVAADEGLKPQTIEAIQHAKAANIPIIVALNKIDKPNADLERCKQQLAEHELVSEDWGGTTVMVPLSAKSKQGIDELLDMIILIADMKELKANFKGRAKGVVIESRLSKNVGPVATILIKTGTVKMGDPFVIGSSFSKVRALINDQGERVKSASPGDPVEVMGISDVPQPGEFLEVVDTEKQGKVIIEERKLQEIKKGSRQMAPVSLEALSQQAESGELQKLNLIIKADVNGSLDGILQAVHGVEAENIVLNIILSSTGTITENDILLARASDAFVIGFNVAISPEAKIAADAEGIEIRLYSIIYEIIDDVNKAIEGMYKPEYEEIEVGRAEIRKLYKFSKVGSIAGCYVVSGKMLRNADAGVLHEKEVTYKGKIVSLKRFQEDVKEVLSGFECGVVLDKAGVIKEGDFIICYQTQEKKR